MTQPNRRTCISAALCCSTILSATSFAQSTAQSLTATQSGTQNAAPTRRSSGLAEEIVVTARRRAERLQKVPIAVTAFSETKLRQQSISNSNDLNKAVPGLAVVSSSGNPGIPVFAIRGRGQNFGAAAGDVETYFADVPLSGSFQAPVLPPQFFDVQSFQVLKGPQGTLFGRSTTGGAVLIVPEPPHTDLGGYLRLQGGTNGDFQAEGAVNVPIQSDKVALRVAFFDWQRDGYSHTYPGTTDSLTGQTLPSQTYNNQDVTEVRTTLLVKPTDWLKNSTIFTYHRDQNIYSPGSGLVLAPIGVDGALKATGAPGYGSSYTDSDVNLQKVDDLDLAVFNTTTADAYDWLTFKNIFGYINAKGVVGDGNNADGTASTIISLPPTPRRSQSQQVTDEVQAQGHWLDNRLTGIVGFLYDHTYEPDKPDDINFESITILSPGSTSPVVPTTVSSVFSDNTATSYGAFGSVSYKFTPKLSVSIGYRHSFDSVSLLTGQVIAPVLQTPNAEANIPSVLGASTFFKRKFQGNTANIDIDYNVDDKTLVYAGYRRGYKRGGFNASQTDPSLANFGPESVDDFNAGLKTDFHVGSVPVRFNIEGYYDLYDGSQVSFLGLSPEFQITTITTNVNNTSFRGFDSDITAAPTPWLLVTGNYSYLNAVNTKWTDVSVPGVTQDLSRNPVPYAPNNKFTVTTRFHTDLPAGRGELAFAPTLNYQDSFVTYPNAVLLPLATQVLFGGNNFNGRAAGGDRNPQFFTVDLRGEWNQVMGSKFDAAFNITNLTNKVYYTGNTATILFGVEGYAYAPPRLFTFEVTRKF